MIDYNNKYFVAEDDFAIDETKFPKSNSLRQETELFDDEEYVPQEVVSVKMIDIPNGQDWHIQVNKKTKLILKGVRFSKKERKFFNTVEGMVFIINGYKQGWKSVSEFKRQLEMVI